ncbi:EF-hand calcium-binding domain-containing protein 1-like [Liolophura sinensis]|uniref:EF-hand calcium-binding domain-containing protein 1-like n=1 Tax=Liolophura sinensis TaxID=3198878 RepID=UPI0031584EF9
MNCKLVALLAVFCAVLLTDTDALRLRIRGRRIWRRIKKPVCRAACTYTCTAVTSGSAAPVCGVGCREACSRRKRSQTELFHETKNQVVIPLPRDFDLYDTNKDGVIKVTELAELLSLEPSRDDVIKAFSLADFDDDNQLSKAEFLEAPWFFEQAGDEIDDSKGLSEEDMKIE